MVKLHVNRKEAETLTIDFSVPLVLLCLFFLILKFFGFIQWSLWWVFSPIWIIPVAVIAFFTIAIVMAIVCFMAVGILEAFSAWRSRRRWAKQARNPEKFQIDRSKWHR